MVEKVIGFIGCYHHDLILLFGKALTAMKRKVLFVDRNAAHILKVSFPVPEGLSSKLNVISYDDLFYTEMELSVEMFQSYDYILIDFGIRSLHFDSKLCNRFYLISDMLPHHLQKLSEIQVDKENVSAILIRDAIFNVKKNREELQNFLKEFDRNKVFFLPTEKCDIKNRFVCEMQNEFLIKNASEELQRAIFEMVQSLLQGVTEKEYRKTLHMYERRRYS